MALRKRNSPGIEINEIDRSQYDKQTDYSLPNAPTFLITGFADKGENYKTQWINSRNTFIDTYGIPNNTAEQYFYNAAIEILSHGGILLTHKLPYNNESKDRLSYVEYEFSKNKKITDNSSDDYYNVKETDSTLTSYIQLEKKNSIRTLSLEEYDKLLTSQNLTKTNSKAAISGKITIVNISNNKYEKTSWNSIKYTGNEKEIYTNDCLGIVPIIVTASNALYYQKILNLNNIDNDDDNDIKNIIDQYSTISNVEVRTSINKIDQTIFKNNTCNDIYLNRAFKSEDIITNDVYIDNSWSKIFADYFPNITYNTFDTLDKENLKNICIIVAKIFEDKTSNKLNFEILESFVGSVDRAAKDANTKSSIFIDNVVNYNSKYINVFTNIDKDELDKACFLTTKNQIAESMGFFEYECTKNIDYSKSIISPLNKLFSTFNNSTTTNIDIIVDAGISNIAQFLINGENKSFDFDNEITFEKNDDIKNWRNVLEIFNTFCSFIRKDCIFLADSPRPLCLEGNQKKIRYTKPENTIENTIISKIKLISNINSSYIAGYCNWFYCPDQYTGDFFWCPPSIKAAGIYCDVDINSYPWSAPAGVHRGKVFNTFDTAFSPTDDEAGKIYTYCWNYAINYPIDGIILEGQKTFQKNKTALDRINVRRLMLYLEKRTKRIARIFLYEGNTAFLRQKFVDTLKPLFEDAKNNYGISDYVIKCDEVNNTAETIERGELHVAIAVKPIKTVEYIVINFIVTNQSANVNEEVLQ